MGSTAQLLFNLIFGIAILGFASIKLGAKKHYVLLAIGAIATPIVLNYGLFTWSAPGVVGDANSWLGFLANYSGGILGGLIAYIVAKIQIDAQKTAIKKEEFSTQLPTLVKIKMELEKFNLVIQKVKSDGFTKDKFEIYSYYFTPIEKMDEGNWSSLDLLVNTKLLATVLILKNKYSLFIDALSYDLNVSYVIIEDAKLNKEKLEQLKIEKGTLSKEEELEIKRFNGIFNRYRWENIQMKQLKAGFWDELFHGDLEEKIEECLEEINELINQIEKDE
ncbi:hypothetical protein P4V43_28880 [Brevibacillus fortis]|uniref:Uncharacterized protein n=1 Tax=Brevibacillus fortis TaxID=2126352 RepID=A0A2P7V730_9BACL|nr:hypothetical protein [Brevibacillus fortis]MED1785821.1 hypothetical protein [Brevibacillus fortis]PSJ95011.1 hypothetical protein C7R93_13375 [Brevibacillus fortis]